MDLVEQAGDKIEEALNAEGRSHGHVALGVLIALGAVGATAAIASLRPQPAAPGSTPQPPSSPMRAVWPALFSFTTVAAIRVWNAPHSPARTQALTLWGAMQGVNAVWMIVRPTRQATQAAAAISTAAITMIYARAAGRVDEKAARMVAPAGWTSLAGLIAGRPTPPQSVH